jgi:D-amino-acid dehydrogenase
MKIAVIGAGIIGVTTAFELAQDGHEVTVFERRIAAAEEASFANAGIISPGYIAPWAAPGMPFKIARHLFAKQAPVRFSLPLSGGDMAWMWKCWRACKPPSYERNRSRLLRLALYSRERLRDISADLKLEYDRTSGVMVLLRSKRDSALMQPSLQVLRNAAIAFRELSPEQARGIELALNPDTAFHSAIHLPGDEVANCRQFALQLKNIALGKGVQFEFGTEIQDIDTSAGMALRIAGQATRRFDATVVCAGVDSARLLRPLGLKIPLAAVYGYSVSAALREALNAPRSAVIDERFKVAITRLGNRVRVAGSAEIGGHPASQRTSAIQMLYKVLQDWFPGAAQLSTGVQVWKGARPMLPDGPPLLGASGVPGLWLNLGHGSSGWALSCGSARAVADLIGGRAPQIDLEGLDIARLQSQG